MKRAENVQKNRFNVVNAVQFMSRKVGGHLVAKERRILTRTTFQLERRERGGGESALKIRNKFMFILKHKRIFDCCRLQQLKSKYLRLQIALRTKKANFML